MNPDVVEIQCWPVITPASLDAVDLDFLANRFRYRAQNRFAVLIDIGKQEISQRDSRQSPGDAKEQGEPENCAYEPKEAAFEKPETVFESHYREMS